MTTIKSVYAINKMASGMKIENSHKKLPWSKVANFSNTIQLSPWNQRDNGVKIINFLEDNNIPFILDLQTPACDSNTFKTYDIYIDTSKVSREDYLYIIEIGLMASLKNNNFRKMNSKLFYKEFYEIYGY
jgi:hypothetical protein